MTALVDVTPDLLAIPEVRRKYIREYFEKTEAAQGEIDRLINRLNDQIEALIAMNMKPNGAKTDINLATSDELKAYLIGQMNASFAKYEVLDGKIRGFVAQQKASAVSDSI